MMLKLGVIGTNWITEQFIQATKITGKYQLNTVYSRSKNKAQTIANKYHAKEIFTNLESFFSKGDFEIVCIASPNSLHFKQAKSAIAAGKHIIVEKPAFSSPSEMLVINNLLLKNTGLFFFEAARRIYEPNFKAVQAAVTQLDKLQGVTLTYMKYSTRYDQVLAGGEPNIFPLSFLVVPYRI
ncbi:putative oxidoreductase (putative) [Loigolactobacillus coryniformis subsp. coryniformis KCTC 3167 = DSM 20001]|uniref:Putative oxidoreductase (Putative) n=2 Tax=Loigolactobacillus coryniformis TaxID=1610 RepID=A0A0R1EQZ6_9LACO|nr:putative oxidoreductase (putative) [Loigolactobacillus coryniformis subsp. coryniformis KCTC 3167 = DSM 20001]